MTTELSTPKPQPETECKHEWGFEFQRPFADIYIQHYRCNVCKEATKEFWSEQSWYILPYPRNFTGIPAPTESALPDSTDNQRTKRNSKRG